MKLEAAAGQTAPPRTPRMHTYQRAAPFAIKRGKAGQSACELTSNSGSVSLLAGSRPTPKRAAIRGALVATCLHNPRLKPHQ